MGSRDTVRRSVGPGAVTEIARIEKRRRKRAAVSGEDPHRIRVLILCDVEVVAENARLIERLGNSGGGVPALPVLSGPGLSASTRETHGEVLLDYRLRINGEAGCGGMTLPRPVKRT